MGTEAIQLTVAAPHDTAKHPLVIDLHAHHASADNAVEVSLRRAPKKVHGTVLTTAITDFMAAHYAVDRDHVTVR